MELLDGARAFALALGGDGRVIHHNRFAGPEGFGGRAHFDGATARFLGLDKGLAAHGCGSNHSDRGDRGDNRR